jgi:hypothetical protein
VFTNPIFDEANTTKIGRLHVGCVVTSPGRQSAAGMVCTGSVKLTDGQITLTTQFTGNPKSVTGAITGGDGAYAGARGSFTSENKDTGDNKDVFTLLG